jgi:hypothetical protein
MKQNKNKQRDPKKKRRDPTATHYNALERESRKATYGIPYLVILSKP